MPTPSEYPIIKIGNYRIQTHCHLYRFVVGVEVDGIFTLDHVVTEWLHYGQALEIINT